MVNECKIDLEHDIGFKFGCEKEKSLVVWFCDFRFWSYKFHHQHATGDAGHLSTFTLLHPPTSSSPPGHHNHLTSLLLINDKNRGGILEFMRTNLVDLLRNLNQIR